MKICVKLFSIWASGSGEYLKKRFTHDARRTTVTKAHLVNHLRLLMYVFSFTQNGYCYLKLNLAIVWVLGYK